MRNIYISMAIEATIMLKIASLNGTGRQTRHSNLTQEELIRGCVRREAAAQKAVFDLYAGRMLGVCQRYARNTMDAEDMLQDAFIKVFEKINQFKNEGSFEGWIRKIVVNTALKKYTVSRYTMERFDKDVESYDERYQTDATPFTNLTEKEILELIHALPDGYRIIFNLYVIEGYRHEEIAVMLQINSGTSRSQLAKARAMLQKQILAKQKLAI